MKERGPTLSEGRGVGWGESGAPRPVSLSSSLMWGIQGAPVFRIDPHNIFFWVLVPLSWKTLMKSFYLMHHCHLEQIKGYYGGSQITPQCPREAKLGVEPCFPHGSGCLRSWGSWVRTPSGLGGRNTEVGLPRASRSWRCFPCHPCPDYAHCRYGETDASALFIKCQHCLDCMLFCLY